MDTGCKANASLLWAASSAYSYWLALSGLMDQYQVAAYVTSKECPKDPRLSNKGVTDLTKQYHQYQADYGKAVDNGPLLGSKAYSVNPTSSKTV